MLQERKRARRVEEDFGLRYVVQEVRRIVEERGKPWKARILY
jgi:transposase